MAKNSDTQIVEAPLTEAKITAAMDAARAAVGVSGPVAISSFNQGRSLIVTCTAPAYS